MNGGSASETHTTHTHTHTHTDTYKKYTHRTHTHNTHTHTHTIHTHNTHTHQTHMRYTHTVSAEHGCHEFDLKHFPVADIGLQPKFDVVQSTPYVHTITNHVPELQLSSLQSAIADNRGCAPALLAQHISSIQ